MHILKHIRRLAEAVIKKLDAIEGKNIVVPTYTSKFNVGDTVKHVDVSAYGMGSIEHVTGRYCKVNWGSYSDYFPECSLIKLKSFRS